MMNFTPFIAHALAEDVGEGDHTSMACIPSTATGKAHLIIKEDCIIAGIELAGKIFHYISPEMKFAVLIKDGNKVKKGDIAFTVEGRARDILKGERLVLNCMQRMSGIATITGKMVDALKGTKTKLLDTRKTTPGFRTIEKWAVKIGGGENHRSGLYDMILIKDNHIDYAGGIRNAISSARKYLMDQRIDLTIEIEARNLDEVREILAVGGVDRIMLDNFSIGQTKEAVKLIAGNYETETSGNITFENIRDHGACGVDFISMGMLTHSYKSIDMSLKATR